MTEADGGAMSSEKRLQVLFEKNLKELLGIDFLEREYSISEGCRIDTIGLDEDNRPVIIEYKRQMDEGAITQASSYLNQLNKNFDKFKFLVTEKFDLKRAKSVKRNAAIRVICVAAEFSKHARGAAETHNIELVRYREFSQVVKLLALELPEETAKRLPNSKKTSGKGRARKAAGRSSPRGGEQERRYKALADFVASLGDDVREEPLKNYINFRCIGGQRAAVVASVLRYKNKMTLYVNLDPRQFTLTPGFTRNVRGKGHWGVGDLEISINSDEDLENAKPLIQESYRINSGRTVVPALSGAGGRVRGATGRASPGMDPRLPPVGTTILREYRGRTYGVRVLDGGFAYKGRRYGSLTAVAREITGYRTINGFDFFNLNKK